MNISPYKPNEIYCGDNAKLIKALPDNCIDLTVTSPPYDNLRDYQGYSWDFETLAKELFRVTKDGGVVVWVVGYTKKNHNVKLTPFRHGLGFQDVNFNVLDIMIYHKSGSHYKHNHRIYPKEWEFMFVLSKGKHKTFNPIKDRKNSTNGQRHHKDIKRGTDGNMTQRKSNYMIGAFGIRTNVWKIVTGFGYSSKDKIAHKHPAIFPEALARDHIISWSNPGDIVLDPFMGSGTTAKMAKECQRHYLGFEISQEYIDDIANERLRQNKLYGPKHITNSS